MASGPIDVNVAASVGVGAPIVRVYLLGRFAVQVGERWAADWRLRKAAAVVKLLALAPDRCLHREALEEHLWPEQEPALAHASLRYALHMARRTLHADPAVGRRLLGQRGCTVNLGLDVPVWVDAAAFDATAQAAERSDSLAARQAALAIYAGDLLPDERCTEWAIAPREALRNRYLHLSYDLARQQVAEGELVGAEATLQRLLAEEPAFEEAHLLQMMLYARQGRRYWALRQFQVLEAALRAELDAAPGPGARRLLRALREGQEIDALFDQLVAS